MRVRGGGEMSRRGGREGVGVSVVKGERGWVRRRKRVRVSFQGGTIIVVLKHTELFHSDHLQVLAQPTLPYLALKQSHITTQPLPAFSLVIPQVPNHFQSSVLMLPNHTPLTS